MCVTYHYVIDKNKFCCDGTRAYYVLTSGAAATVLYK